MYRRSELSPTLTHYSNSNKDVYKISLGRETDSTIQIENANDNHYRNDGQPLSEASTFVDLTSIVDNSNNMDQLPISSHTHGKLQKRGKLVTFFRNGDQHFKGITIPISQKWFMTLETLIMYLNEKISTPTGIRYIFNLANGNEIKDVSEFSPGESYIVSSVKKLVYEIHYGQSLENHWINKPPSASKIRRNDHYLFIKNYEEVNQMRNSQISLRDIKRTDIPNNLSPRRLNSRISKPKPIGREILIISNTNRKSFHIMVVERQNDKKFEDMLYDISDMLELLHPPVQTLFTFSKPHKRVCSFTHLFKEFLHEDKFVACGSEFYPVEMKKKKKNLLIPDEIFSSKSKDSYNAPSTNSHESKSTQTSDVYPLLSDKPTPENKESQIIIPQKQQLSSPQFLTINSKERIVYATKSDLLSPMKLGHRKYSLKLNWIYGFNANVPLNCLDVLNPSEFIYCVGKVAVIYNIVKYQQRYFLEHTSEISCFTVHSNRKYVASSQSEISAKSVIYIWNSDECNIINIISGSLSEHIFGMDFSNDESGEFLMVLDCCRDLKNQSLKIFNWQKNIKVAVTNCNRELVKGGRFHPDDNSTLITFGYQHINIWRIFWQERGLAKILRDKKSGLFDFCIPENVNYVTFDLMGNIITGDSNGSVHLWSKDEEEAFINRTLPQLFHAHKDKISCLVMIGDGTLISSSNYSIKAWDSFNDFKFVKERNIPSSCGKITSIVSCHPEQIDGKLWIATELSTVLEGTLQDQFDILFQHHSHSKGHLRLVASPTEHCFVSGGSDTMIMKCSMLQQHTLWAISVDIECTALAFYIDGNYLAIGTKNGKLVILQSATGAHVMSLQVDLNQNPISCMQYSPDGKLLSIGIVNADLKMFSVLDQGAFCRHMPQLEFQNSKDVVRIDWTLDSQVFRTEDIQFNNKIWLIYPKTKEIGAEKNSHMDFISDNCLVTFKNLSLWRSPLINELTAVNKGGNDDFVVYGTSNGAMGLVNLPKTDDPVDGEQMCFNNGPVKHLSVSFDNTYVLSSCDDKSCSNILQWSIVEE